MQSSKTLPKTHKGKQIACIELEKSRLLARLIKIIQAITAVLLLIAGGLLMPFSALIELKEPFEHLTVLMLGMIAVSIFQELGRGLLMCIFSGLFNTACQTFHMQAARPTSTKEMNRS